MGRYAVAPSRFAAQMEWLARTGHRGVSVKDAFGSDVGDRRRLVVLTFDDGCLDNYTDAFPILTQCGFSATFFVPTAYVGRTTAWWRATPANPLMNWEQIAEMAAAGMEFGSHTASHLDLRELDADRVAEELLTSKRAIEGRTNVPVVSFAYPHGYFRSTMREILAKTGYQYGFLGVTYGRNSGRTNPYELHRTPV